MVNVVDELVPIVKYTNGVIETPIPQAIKQKSQISAQHRTESVSISTMLTQQDKKCLQ